MCATINGLLMGLIRLYCPSLIFDFHVFINQIIVVLIVFSVHILLHGSESANITWVPVFQFGIFGICDGHGGAEAAKSASKLVLNLQFKSIMWLPDTLVVTVFFFFFYRLLPEIVANLLSDSLKRERVLLQCDASDVLRDAFYQTEASLNYHYEVFPSTWFMLFCYLLVSMFCWPAHSSCYCSHDQ